MRQKIKYVSRKEKDRQKTQARKSARTFIGTCSKCRDKKVTVTKFRGSQLCIGKCLTGAITRLGGGVMPPVPADQAIVVDSQPLQGESLFTGKVKE